MKLSVVFDRHRIVQPFCIISFIRKLMVSRIIPMAKRINDTNINADARMAVGKRDTNPVWKYSKIGINPILNPINKNTKAEHPKNRKGR